MWESVSVGECWCGRVLLVWESDGVGECWCGRVLVWESVGTSVSEEHGGGEGSGVQSFTARTKSHDTHQDSNND